MGGRAPQPLGPPWPPAHPRLLPTFCPASFLHSLRTELGSQRCGRGAAGDVPWAPGPGLGNSCDGPCAAELCRELRPHTGVACGFCGWAGAAGHQRFLRVDPGRGASHSVGRLAQSSFLWCRTEAPLSAAVRCPEAPPSWCVFVLTWLLCPDPRRRFPREEVLGTFTRDVLSCSKASHGSCPHSWGPHTGWTPGRGRPGTAPCLSAVLACRGLSLRYPMHTLSGEGESRLPSLGSLNWPGPGSLPLVWPPSLPRQAPSAFALPLHPWPPTTAWQRQTCLPLTTEHLNSG